jgi:hypothetical protein
VRGSVLLANFSKSVAPVLEHAFLLYINVSIIIGRGMFLLFLIMIQRRKD